MMLWSSILKSSSCCPVSLGIIHGEAGWNERNAAAFRWTKIPGSSCPDICYPEMWSSSILLVWWNWPSLGCSAQESCFRYLTHLQCAWSDCVTYSTWPLRCEALLDVSHHTLEFTFVLPFALEDGLWVEAQYWHIGQLRSYKLFMV